MFKKKTVNIWKRIGISVLLIILLYFFISLWIWLYNLYDDLQRYPNSWCIELPGWCKCEPQRQQCRERRKNGKNIVCPVECDAYEDQSWRNVWN